MGKPLIKEIRITVEMILEKLLQGISVEELVQAHPRLSARHIFAALAFAKKLDNGQVDNIHRPPRFWKPRRSNQQI